MMRPSIINGTNFLEDLFDEFFETPFMKGTGLTNVAAMKTDIKESDSEYEVIMDLPGFTKEDVKAELKDGYLTVLASHTEETNEADEGKKYVRKERYTGHYKRDFFVGDAVTEEDIKARFKDGVLTIIVPKKTKEPEIEEKKYIAIED